MRISYFRLQTSGLCLHMHSIHPPYTSLRLVPFSRARKHIDNTKRHMRGHSAAILSAAILLHAALVSAAGMRSCNAAVKVRITQPDLFFLSEIGQPQSTAIGSEEDAVRSTATGSAEGFVRPSRSQRRV